MLAYGVFTIGLALLSFGCHPINGFDLNKLRDDAQWHQFQSTPEADNDKNQDLRDVYAQFFRVAPDVRYRTSNLQQRPPWDAPEDEVPADNVDENGDETTYRIRKRYYVPSVSCDSGAVPSSLHGNGVSKLMRLPRRIHRRSVDENDNSRRRRAEENDEMEKRRVKVNDNELQVTTEEETSDSKALPETTQNIRKRVLTGIRGHDDDDDEEEEEEDGNESDTEDRRDEDRALPNRITTNDSARGRPHSLSEMLDLQRKLRYEGIHMQAASGRREGVRGNEHERERGRDKLMLPGPTRLPEDPVMKSSM